MSKAILSRNVINTLTLSEVCVSAYRRAYGPEKNKVEINISHSEGNQSWEIKATLGDYKFSRLCRYCDDLRAEAGIKDDE